MLRVLFCSPCCLAPPGKTRAKAYRAPDGTKTAGEADKLKNGKYRFSNLAVEGSDPALAGLGAAAAAAAAATTAANSTGAKGALDPGDLRHVVQSGLVKSSGRTSQLSTAGSTSFKDFADFDKSRSVSATGGSEGQNSFGQNYDLSLAGGETELEQATLVGTSSGRLGASTSHLLMSTSQQLSGHHQDELAVGINQLLKGSSSSTSQLAGRPLESRAIVTMTSTTRIGEYARLEYSKLDDFDSEKSTTTNSHGHTTVSSREVSQCRDSNDNDDDSKSDSDSDDDYGGSDSDTASSDSFIVTPLDALEDRRYEQHPSTSRDASQLGRRPQTPSRKRRRANTNTDSKQAAAATQSNHDSRAPSPGLESTSLSIASQLSNEQLELSLTNALESVLAAPNQTYGTIGLPLGPPVDRYPSETTKTSPDTTGAALTVAPSEFSSRPSSPVGALMSGIQSVLSGSQGSSLGAALVAGSDTMSPETSTREPQLEASGSSSTAGTLPRAAKREANKDVLSKFRAFAKKVLKDPKAKSMAKSDDKASETTLNRLNTQSPSVASRSLTIDREYTPTPSEISAKKKSKGLFGQVSKILKDKKKHERSSPADASFNTL